MTQIDWIRDDAGFSPGVFDSGRKVTKLNSQVAALTIFWNETHPEEEVTYDDMYVTLTLAMRAWRDKPGRRSKKRLWFQQHPTATLHSFRMPKEFYKPWIEENFSVVWIPTQWIGDTGGSGGKLHLDNDVFDRTQPVLARLSGDELVPVIDGAARYPWDPNHRYAGRGSRLVYGYWTTP
jgi:hypothetical protein